MNNFIFGSSSAENQRLLIPQVIQSSMMDCGPAALKAMLEGFGIHVSYGRLREACQTDVDGTSIDNLEELAIELGLDAVQILLPADHLFLPETLPALVVMRQPNGLTHFVVIWRLHGSWVQIMDPTTGRHWVPIKTLFKRIYIHKQAVAVEDWLEWASNPGFCEPLIARLLNLCDDPKWAEACVQQAVDSKNWYNIATLDAATRMMQSLVDAGGIELGTEAGELLNQFQQQPKNIPQAYWSAFSLPDDEENIVFQGAVLIHVAGLQEEETETPEKEKEEKLKPSPTVLAALHEPAPIPEQHIWQALRADGLFSPIIISIAFLLTGLGITLEVVVLRGLMEMGQQANVFALVILFLFSLLLLEWPLHLASLRLGRKFELRLRQRFLEKIAKLDDRYFHSRLISDMIQRAYELRQLRAIPMLGMNFIQIIAQIFFISIGLIILYPEGMFLIVFTSLFIIEFSLLTQPIMQEQDMRFRTHTASLSRFYLDALQGLLPIRSHRAMPALRSEHERFLVNWANAGKNFFFTTEALTLLNLVLSTGIAIWLVFSYMQSGGNSGGTLILLYWMLMLPKLGRSLAETVQQYPSLRNRLLRLLEPLNAPDENYDNYPIELTSPSEVRKQEISQGVAINFSQVDLILSRQTVLHNLNAQISSGEHIAIVGVSGAGKSSLVGLLLGWYYPKLGGSVWVDGELLQGKRLQQLRRELVWVDPEVQLWNRSLIDNLNYGNDKIELASENILSQADLLELLNTLPNAEHTLLGENGKRLSGGEGQRIRLGRAMNRDNPRLVILDEPFRGLSRKQRHNLLTKARSYWKDATLIFISHDISDSQDFDRVWVIDEGRLIEDENPQTLLNNPKSHYTQLLNTEKSVREMIWSSTDWIRLKLEKGQLSKSA